MAAGMRGMGRNTVLISIQTTGGRVGLGVPLVCVHVRVYVCNGVAEVVVPYGGSLVRICSLSHSVMVK
jgi:hypothetical protein